MTIDIACAECGAIIPSPQPQQRFCSEMHKDRAGHRRRYWATPRDRAQPRVLTCQCCGVEWTRLAQTGRLPHLCPDCRNSQ